MAKMADRIIPSSERLLEEAIHLNPSAGINQLHAETYRLMKKYREDYYSRKIDAILGNLNIPEKILEEVRRELLKPVMVENNGNTVEYSNAMEEAARRVSQSFQSVSGNLAELCAIRELELKGLKRDVHFTRREKRSDITVYYQKIGSAISHRTEVKNAHLRERAVRGLAFDGDSLLGFFVDPNEFTEETVSIIDQHCFSSGGYCYVPPETLNRMRNKGERFKSNTEFAKDMEYFSRNGRMP